MNNTTNILKTILVLQILQFLVLLSYELKFNRVEKNISDYFAPVEDVELPKWEEQH